MSTTSEVREASYTYEESSRTPVITLKSAMAQFPLGQVEEVGNALIERLNTLRPSRLVVDLTDLNYMGSAMVDLIVRLWNTIKDEKGHKMVVAVDGEGVLEVLELARLTDHWTMVRSREEAQKILGLRAPKPGGGATSIAGSGSGGESPILPVVAVVSIVAALCGAVLILVQSPLVPAATALGITCVAALAGLIVGTLMLLGQSLNRKIIGGVAVGLCAVAIIMALATYST